MYTSLFEFNNPRYLLGLSDDPKQLLQPISGYASEPLLLLEEACEPLLTIVPQLPAYIWIAKQNSKNPANGLTQDESAAIRLYTMEWETHPGEPHASLYAHLNRTLKLVDRTKLRPWFRYLKLFLTALAKLTSNSHQTVWRGVRKNHSDDYPPGADVTWWAFSSCTASLSVLESDLYLGNTGIRTLFSIEAINTRTVRSHSHFTTEDEILLLPGSYFEVKSRLNPAPDLYLIHLIQKVPPHVLLEPPFEGAKLLPPSELNRPKNRSIQIQYNCRPWYKKNMIRFIMGVVLAVIIVALVLGTVLGTRHTTTTTTTSSTPTLTRWSNTGYMNNARGYHTSSVLTNLTNGKVLVSGGQGNGGAYLNSSELYDPSTGVWTVTGSMNNARGYHTASVLTNGKVLVSGGYNSGLYLNSGELYDPSTGVWNVTGNMTNARCGHTASVLTNGKVLVSGGQITGGYLNSSELYDPSTEVWNVTGNINNARAYHTASVLTNGKVLVSGGWVGGSVWRNSAELYDPSTGVWNVTGNMTNARSSHTASVLTNGKVLVSGGQGHSAAYLNSAELYNLSTGVWNVTGDMNNARMWHTASVLTNGKVLVSGGEKSDRGVLNSVELYDPSTGVWNVAENMTNAHRYHTASILTNGKVLVSGGDNSSGYLNSAELYQP